MNLTNRIKDLNILLDKLDISKTMIENATEKYQNISKYLHDQGIEADIYSQGSFAIGTVIRPYTYSQNKNYDLDFVCKINISKENCSPEEIKHLVGNALKNSAIYSDRLEDEWDRCWTLVYADVDEIGFSMDIVPAVEENQHKKNLLRTQIQNPDILDNAISLTEKVQNDYSWLTNNPKGYQIWFNDINIKFREWQLSQFNQYNRTYYSSIEDIPKDIGKSSLQKVIQVLKRHRDVYFFKFKLETQKPISAIITTLVASIAETAPNNFNTYELLDFVTKELMIYSQRKRMTEIEFYSQYPQKKLIQKIDGEWQLPNPANPEDNLIDSWKKEENSHNFFDWIEAIKNDFVDAFAQDDEHFLRGIENGLGSQFVRNTIQTRQYSHKTPTISINPVKPWRETNESS